MVELTHPLQQGQRRVQRWGERGVYSVRARRGICPCCYLCFYPRGKFKKKFWEEKKYFYPCLLNPAHASAKGLIHAGQFIYLFINLYILLSISYISIYSSFYLFIYLSFLLYIFYLCIYLFIYIDNWLKGLTHKLSENLVIILPFKKYFLPKTLRLDND